MHILDLKQLISLLKTFNKKSMFVLHEYKGGRYLDIECFTCHKKQRVIPKSSPEYIEMHKRWRESHMENEK